MVQQDRLLAYLESVFPMTEQQRERIESFLPVITSATISRWVGHGSGDMSRFTNQVYLPGLTVADDHCDGWENLLIRVDTAEHQYIESHDGNLPGYMLMVGTTDILPDGSAIIGYMSFVAPYPV